MKSVTNRIEIRADVARCSRCLACEEVCPGKVFVWNADAIEVKAPGRCINCGHCVAACPNEALIHSKLPLEKFESLGDNEKPKRNVVDNLFARRRTWRRFTNEPISVTDLEDLIEAGRTAPTPTNSQNVRYLLIDDAKKIARLAELTSRHYLKLERQLNNPFIRAFIAMAVGRKTVNAYRYHMPGIVSMFKETLNGEDRLFYGAPAVIIAYASGLKHLAAASTNLAAMQILLAAESRGFGACYNGYALTALVRHKAFCDELGISRGYTPGAVIAVGRPRGEFHRLPPRIKRRTTVV